MPRYPLAQWRPVTTSNYSPGGNSPRLIVMHIMAGSLVGADGWFHDPASQVSAHFGVGKDGTLYQWVDTADTAWAEMSYNSAAVSIEHEGQSGDTLTPQQLEIDRKLFAWIHSTHGVTLTRCQDPNGHGVIGHGELGAAGGAHPLCPGQPILDQIPAIIASATGPTLTPGSPAYRARRHLPNGPAPVLEMGRSNRRDWCIYARACGRAAGVWPKWLPLWPGLYGPLTHNMVVRFERQRKLAPDGVVTPRVWAAFGLVS